MLADEWEGRAHIEGRFFLRHRGLDRGQQTGANDRKNRNGTYAGEKRIAPGG
jgi:hypothetical protein